MIEIPAAIDPHVHTRGFNQAYKETVETASRAAVAGGVGTIIGMPNYDPLDKRPFSRERMVGVRNQAYWQDSSHKFHPPYCDVGFWATALPGMSRPESLKHVWQLAAGIKFYIEPTQGNDQLVDVKSFREDAKLWHHNAHETQPIAAHVEDESAEEAIELFAKEIGHPLYVPHINNRFLLDAVIKAKKRDLPVYAAVTLDHLFTNEEAVAQKGWFARMKPRLATTEDQEYLWANLDWIDVIETDHAPHTKEEKGKANTENPEGLTGPADVKCFGTPTLEAFMPLLFTAFKDRKITAEQITEKTSTNPAKIFGLKVDKQSTVKIKEEMYEFSEADVYSKCGWNAFEGHVMKGRVEAVNVHGVTVFENGKFLDVEPQGRLLNPACK